MAYKHGAYATVDTSRAKRLRISTSQIVTPGPAEPDPTPAGMCEFVPKSSANAMITSDGAIFYCKMEGKTNG